MKYPFKVMVIFAVIFAKYEKKSIQNNRCYSDKMCYMLEVFIANSWQNYLEDMGQSQKSLNVTHLAMLAIICAKYRKNPFRTVHGAEQTGQHVSYFNSTLVRCR